MKRIIFILVLIVTSLNSRAQINELGVFVGGANYIGDVGPTNYIAPNEPAFGIIYKWNRSPRHSWRASFTYADIKSKDIDSDETSRQQRGYEFKNTIKELSLGLEFNFFDFNLHEPDFKITPYTYIGASYFWADELYISGGETHGGNAKGNFAIPMTVGIKSNLFENFVLGFEVGARYSFTDNIDGSNNPDYKPYAFGNLNNNDWYVFTGFTLTYTFGEQPCYCAQ
ncbi:DUF6089 family protein [Flavobacterium sp. AG291]|uniref:type IX secretion system protein PorG n=1 Tax=Flavobacterium sp. AG291 TaxID=2184000 RepID=UPI000E0C248C|nr:DUF6089 family protein [Flavobacterium sp. AG291]RDI08297.1 hypothetical protein DEU42_111128 [Flavobacterium sp. AG291]